MYPRYSIAHLPSECKRKFAENPTRLTPDRARAPIQGFWGQRRGMEHQRICPWCTACPTRWKVSDSPNPQRARPCDALHLPATGVQPAPAADIVTCQPGYAWHTRSPQSIKGSRRCTSCPAPLCKPDTHPLRRSAADPEPIPQPQLPSPPAGLPIRLAMTAACSPVWVTASPLSSCATAIIPSDRRGRRISPFRQRQTLHSLQSDSASVIPHRSSHSE